MDKNWRSPLLCTLVIVIWGSLYISGRLVLQQIPALWVLFIRYALSSVILLGVGYHSLHGQIAIARKDWGELLFVGVVGYFLSNAALFLGIQYSSASFASLINSLTPVVISGLAIVLLGEKVTKLQGLSLLVAVVGAAVIIGRPTQGVTTAGMVICVFALFSWAYATIHLKKLTARYDPLLVTGYGMAIAALLSLPSAWVFVRTTGAAVSFTGNIWAPLLYTCIVCTALAHLLWNGAAPEAAGHLLCLLLSPPAPYFHGPRGSHAGRSHDPAPAPGSRLHRSGHGTEQPGGPPGGLRRSQTSVLYG